MPEKWKDIAAKKREALIASIPKEWIIPDDVKPPDDQADVTTFPTKSGWFTEKELQITGSTATRLLEWLKSGQWSSVEVTKAFCKRASAAHQLTNCLSETLFDAAIKSAEECDAYLKENGKPKGPLHGLPISIKDNFNVIGTDSTVGFVSWVNDPAKYNAVLVNILRDLGAVLYVKTNVPTAMMIAESVNNVFGRTVNPLNRKLTSGGSSGGESALIAFGGSPLGIGTDIGGSLRIPAACTGIFTLRPSFGRFPTLRARSGLAGQEAVQSVNGPMARTLQDIELFSSTIVGSEPWYHDPRCLPVPWRIVEKKPKLKIGVMWHDGIVRPTPPVAEALRHTVDKLKAAGHELIDWEPIGHKEILELLAKFFVADGGTSVRKILDPVNEPFRPEMKMYEGAKDSGVYDLWQTQLARVEQQKNYLDRWNAAGIDVILCPTTPYASPQHGDFKYVGYTGVYNVLDYSAVSFPTGFIASKDHAPHTAEKHLGDMCRDVQEKYDPELTHGMPVSLQLVARRLEEEKVLAMTQMVVAALSSA